MNRFDLGHGAVQWWWLSFTDPGRPEGSQFLGVTVVQAPDDTSAVVTAHVLGINPGGEVLTAGPLPDDIDQTWCNRLLTKEEAEAFPPPASLASREPS